MYLNARELSPFNITADVTSFIQLYEYTYLSVKSKLDTYKSVTIYNTNLKQYNFIIFCFHDVVKSYPKPSIKFFKINIFALPF